MVNICWKFQRDISNDFWVIMDLLKNSGQHPPMFSKLLLKVGGSAERRQMLTRIFQLIHDYSKTVWDISLKFSAYVQHMTALIWHKNFGHCLLGKTAAPSIKPKLWKSLAALFVEIFSKKILGGGFRPIWVTQWQEFEIFPQKWRFHIFQLALLFRWLQWFLYYHTSALSNEVCNFVVAQKLSAKVEI